jgi:hypothetical protein
MRLALLTLAASAAVLSTAAFAQDPAAAPAAPAAPAAAPAPDAAAPAPDAAAPAAPADAGAPAAAPAAPPAPPPQELAPLPTDPLGLTLIDTLEKICKPIAMGTGKLDDLAKADGFALKRKMWTKAIDTMGTQVVLQPTSVANPTTCTMIIDHPKGGFQNLVNGMHAWASRQDPVMQLRAPYAYDDQIAKVKRTTVGWEAPSVTSPTGMTGMAFTQLARLDGKDIVRNMDESELMFQIRK